MIRFIVLTSLMITVFSGLMMSMMEVGAAPPPERPCEFKKGTWSVCGDNANAEPGECFYFVGTGSCTETATHVCNSVEDWWCHKDDECSTVQSTDTTYQCDTSNYAGTTSLWYFDCPAEAGQLPSPCQCQRYDDPINTKPLTWKRFDGGGKKCP